MDTLKSLFLIVGDLRTLEARPVLSSIRRIRSGQNNNCLSVPEPETALTRVPAGTTRVFLAGVVSTPQLVELALRLRQSGRQVLLLIDALEVLGHKDQAFEELELKGFQLSRIDAASALAASQDEFVYAYAKAETTASVVAICAKTQRVLLVQRAIEPFFGYQAIPGGFLRPLLETLEECAARELAEETGLQVHPDELTLVACRSNINRDNRGHVIDHCYLAVYRDGINQESISAGDDAQAATLVPIDQALRQTLAADHNGLLREAVQKYQHENRTLRSLWQHVCHVFRSGLSERTA